MLKQISTQSSQHCSNCTKNCTLIKKYEELIRLYKKKQVKLSIDGSSRLSNGRTTSNTLELPSYDAPCAKLVEVLAQITKKKLAPLYRFSLPKSAKKFIFLNIFNRFDKFAKVSAFNKLKQIIQQPQNQRMNLPDQKIKQFFTKSLLSVNNNENSVIQQIINDLQIRPQQIEKSQIKKLKQLSSISQSKNNIRKQLQRKNMQLQIINKKLVLQNQNLKQCLEQLAKRQAKQNQKKKQSLQMLAQQIGQKNQQIFQLKQTLKAYQQTYQPNGNVLQDDVIQMKKDIDHLQNIRNRLNNDLDNIRDQLNKVNNNLKLVTQQKQQLQKQNFQIKKFQFEATLKSAKQQKTLIELNQFIKSMEKKMKRLNIYERQLQQALVNSKPVEKCESEKVQQQIKSQIILMYLANIGVGDYKIHAEHLFDQDQKNLLRQHKQAWHKNQIQAKMFFRHDNVSKLNHLQISQIQVKGKNMDSVLMALDSPRQAPRKSEFTMKLLQMQLQKNKQVQKITELKEKILHIRVIILKLLKSLEIQPGVRVEVDGIIRVLTDLFEYSEQQRQNIFAKKKKIFGFI